MVFIRSLSIETQKPWIGEHINKLMTLVEGDLIVIAAGDDISLPERVESIYSAWAQHNFAPSSIHSHITK